MLSISHRRLITLSFASSLISPTPILLRGIPQGASLYPPQHPSSSVDNQKKETTMMTVPTADTVGKIPSSQIDNPYRSQVLSWYRKCLKSAFDVEWNSDGDALYVLEETRKLFRQNQNILDKIRIAKKLEEVEQRYGLALHYKIPYPRMFHKTYGAMPDSLGAYATYLDSHYDYNNCEIHPGQSVDREDTGAPSMGDSQGMMKGPGGGQGDREEF